MRYIYFVRHSIRDFTIREDRKVPLTTEGMELANELKSFFINKNISAIYTSPYLRAVQTVKPTSELLGIKMILQEELRERSVGTWVDNFSDFSLNQWNNFDFKLESGESLNEVQKRMKVIYNEILSHEKSNIIISGHGTSLAVLFNSILDNNFGFKEFTEMKMPDIYCAKYKNSTLVEFFNPAKII